MQYSISNNKSPLLPPNMFRYIDGRTNFKVNDAHEARRIYRKYSSFNSNRNNKRKYVNGALYSSLFDNHVDFIDPIPGGRIILKVSIQDTNDVSDVIITCSVDIKDKYLTSLNDLGVALSNMGDNTCRNKLHDVGKMNIVGYGKKGNGSSGVYHLTNKNKIIEKAIEKVASLSKKYYSKIDYCDDIESMREVTANSLIHCNSFVSSIVQSEDLVNAAHYDVADTTVSIATWTELDIGIASDWYFIMPNTTRDGSRGIVINLRHGTTIRWDGRKIFHCSSVGDIGKHNHVYGTFYGTKM